MLYFAMTKYALHFPEKLYRLPQQRIMDRQIVIPDRNGYHLNHYHPHRIEFLLLTSECMSRRDSFWKECEILFPMTIWMSY